MNIVVCNDMHSSIRHFREIAEKSRKASLVICAGDVSMFGRKLKKIISMFDRLDKPVLMIPGNHEEKKVLKKLCSSSRNVIYAEGKYFVFNNIVIFLYSADGFSYYDKAFEKKADRFYTELKKARRKNNVKYVFVSHAPPYNTKLDIVAGEHVGSISVKNFIIKSNPVLSVHGHIHPCFGKSDRIKNTRAINAGPWGRIIRL